MGEGAMTEESPSEEVFVEYAQRIVKEAHDRGLILRIMGALAIRLHSPEFEDLHRSLKRLGEREFTDIDLMALGKQRGAIKKFFIKDKGYEIDRMVERLAGGSRHLYYGSKPRIRVDIFYDKLEMCHTIDFRKRLKVDFPTISLADMLLAKMQIVRITEKDIKDAIVLLRAHEVGESDEEEVNAEYIAGLLSSDWGFYYTFTTNLKKIKQLLPKYDVLSEEDRKIISSRIEKTLEYIEKKPKSLGWNLRAKIGTKKKWYREVEEVKW